MMFKENGGYLNRWCEICHGEPHVEHGRTPYVTMDEAVPTLKETERQNIYTREFLLGSRN